MLVQVGLCQTCSKTTLLVFPRGGSNNLVGDVKANPRDFPIGKIAAHSAYDMFHGIST